MSYQPSSSEHAFWQTVDFSSADLSPRIFESGYNMGHLASGRISQRSVVGPSCVHSVQSNLIRRTRWCCQFFEIPPPSPVVTQCPKVTNNAKSEHFVFDFLRSQKTSDRAVVWHTNKSTTVEKGGKIWKWCDLRKKFKNVRKTSKTSANSYKIP